MVTVVNAAMTQFGLGYSYYFGLSSKFLLVLLAGLSVPKIYQRHSRSLLLFCIFLTFCLVQVVLPQFDTHVVLGLIRMLYLFLLFLFARYSLLRAANKKNLRTVVAGWLLFFGVIGSLQFLLGHNLGLYLEEGGVIAPFGYSTNESSFLYRVSGTLGHPTFFASWLSLLLPIGLGKLAVAAKKQVKIISGMSIAAGVLALFATYSRSGWIALGVTGALFVGFFARKKKILLLVSRWRWVLLAGVVIIFLYGGYFFTRLQSFSYIFSLGSGRGRVELTEEAVEMIRSFPFFGVGLNHFTQTMVTQNVSGAAAYFLYPVHNTWLLFASELGLPAVFLFVLFVLYILRRIPKSLTHFSVWVACITFLINSQFHTLFSQDPTLDLFVVFLAYLDTTKST